MAISALLLLCPDGGRLLLVLLLLFCFETGSHYGAWTDTELYGEQVGLELSM